MFNNLFVDKRLYKMIISIALPIALQNLLVFLTQMLDTIMLGELGDVQLTASSLANQVFFVYSLFIYGLSGGGAVLTAQYWGKRDIRPIKIIIAIIVRLVIIVGIILSLTVYLFPKQIMMIFTNDVEVIKSGIEYLKIICIMYLFFGLSSMLTTLFRSVEVVKIAVISNIISLIINGFLNYVFIFGKFGVPRMEIKGAAIATVIAKVSEITIVLIYVFVVDKKLKFTIKDMFAKDKILNKDLIKYCAPVVINELAWSLGITMQSVLFGRISTSAVSANTIIGVVQQLATLVIFGVANASAIIIGKTIGEGKLKLAQQRGKTITILSMLMGLLGAIVIIIFRNVMVDFYNVSEETKQLAKQMLIVTAFVVFFVSNGGVGIVGILRGGGDTKFSLWLEVISLWLVSAPLGFIAGMVFKLPVVVVYALFKSDEVVKSIMCWIRIAGTKWIREVTREKDDVV